MTSVSSGDTKEKNSRICVIHEAWRQGILKNGGDIVSNDEGRVHDR